MVTRCLKNIQKVKFNIASETSYVFILSGQKFIKNAKLDPFWRVFEKLKPQGRISVENAKIEKVKLDILFNFQHGLDDYKTL